MKLRILIIVSRLPYRVLHGIAAILAFIAGDLVGYRKSVIRSNIARSFPGKSLKWKRQVEHRYYRHFADITVESVKHFTISELESKGRMRHVGVALLRPYFDAGKSVLIAGGHMNNWELYALTAHRALSHDVMAIYKRLSDPEMDQAMRVSRERFGLKMVPTLAAKDWMETHQGEGRPKAIVMGFDQSPADPRKAYWTKFLEQETAWYFGLEKFARDYGLPVFYGHIRKESRGVYRTDYELLVDDPHSLPAGAIIDRAIRSLERDIHENPDQWLWSHKRWKHNRPTDLPLHRPLSQTNERTSHV